jgi:putative transposase
MLFRMSEHRRVTYRLYPSTAQNTALWTMHEAHRALYNAALEERREAWRKHERSISFAEQCKSWTEIRREHREYAAINAQSGQVTLKRLQRAFENFFRRVKAGDTPGYPRFKAKHRFSGWGYKTHGDGFRFISGKNWRHGKLRLSGVGTINARGEARVPGEVVTAEIKRDATGWLLSLVLACAPRRERTAEREAGLDWGVETLATLAYGPGSYERCDNDRLGQRAAAVTTEAQRQLARAQRRKRTRRAKKARTQVARRARKLANQRKDRAHKLSARLVREHRLLVTEELSVANMTASAKGTVEAPGRRVAQKAGLNREILDTNPGLLMQLLAYKAEEAGCKLVVLDTRKHKPSQTCPICRARRKKALSERSHACDCGFSASRDQASALHMLAMGLTLEGREPAWVLPPETPSRAA